MRILHISRTMGQGGAEKVVFQLCIDNKRDQQFVASCGGVYVNELENKGIKHITIPDMDNKNPLIILKTLITLNKVIRRERIQIVHSHHRMAAFYARLLQINNRSLKHVYTAHNVFYGKHAFLRFALAHATIVACGKTVKTNLVDEYLQKEEQITVIFNSVKIPNHIANCNDNFGTHSSLIGFVGRLSEQKGIDVFFKAIKIVLQKVNDIKVVIIGDGEDREKLENLSNELGIDDHVLFMGYRKDVYSLIRRMDFLVLPSRWEGFPLTPIEAFSMKKTIIVSDIPNNLEIVNPDYNGLSFEKENQTDLANKIIELITNTSKRQILESNAYTDYVQIYNYSKFICDYQNVYDRVF